jgi:hypothetical protein
MLMFFLAVLSHVFLNSSVHASPLGIWNVEAHLVVFGPDLAALPERHPTTTPAGNLSQPCSNERPARHGSGAGSGLGSTGRLRG